MMKILNILLFIFIFNSVAAAEGDAQDVLNWMRNRGLGETHKKVLEVKKIISQGNADTNPLIQRYIKEMIMLKESHSNDLLKKLEHIHEDIKTSTTVYGLNMNIKGIEFTFSEKITDEERQNKLLEVYKVIMLDSNPKVIGIHISKKSVLLTVRPKDYKIIFDSIHALRSANFQAKGIYPRILNGETLVQTVEYPKDFLSFFNELQKVKNLEEKNK